MTSAVAIILSLLAAALEEEENEEEEEDDDAGGAEMEELLWEGLFLEKALLCAVQGGLQKCVG